MASLQEYKLAEIAGQLAKVKEVFVSTSNPDYGTFASVWDLLSGGMITDADLAANQQTDSWWKKYASNPSTTPLKAFEAAAKKVEISHKAFLSLKGLGLTYPQLALAGPDALQALSGLTVLVKNGQVTAQEAAIYVGATYPGLASANFSSIYVKLGQTALSNTQSAAQGVAEAFQGGASVQEKVLEQAVEQQAETAKGGGPAQFSITPKELPAGATIADFNEVVTDLADQLQAALGKIANGAIKFQPDSISGEAIKQGSLSVGKLNGKQFSSTFQEFPGPEQAIILHIAPDDVADRWITSTITTDYVGPGRIWRVTKYQLPPNWKPSLGPLRYRICTSDMRFGLMACRMLDAVTTDAKATDWALYYGIILRDVPYFGERPPSRMLYFDQGRMSPASLVGINDGASGGAGTGSTNTKRLFEQELVADFVTTPPTLYTSFVGAVTGALTPPASFLQEIEGLSAQLIMGRTAQEVSGELNGMRSPNWAYLGGSSTGHVLTTPEGIEVEPPCPAAVHIKANSSQTACRTKDGYTPTTALLGSDNVFDGIPIVYEDCERLRASSSAFSVVIRVHPHLEYGPGSSTTFSSIYLTPPNQTKAGTWHTFGVKAVPTNGRIFQMDIVVV